MMCLTTSPFSRIEAGGEGSCGKCKNCKGAETDSGFDISSFKEKLASQVVAAVSANDMVERNDFGDWVQDLIRYGTAALLTRSDGSKEVVRLKDIIATSKAVPPIPPSDGETVSYSDFYIDALAPPSDGDEELRELRFELEEARTALCSTHELLIEHQDYMRERGIWEEFLESLSPQPSPDSLALANVARNAR